MTHNQISQFAYGRLYFFNGGKFFPGQRRRFAYLFSSTSPRWMKTRWDDNKITDWLINVNSRRIELVIASRAAYRANLTQRILRANASSSSKSSLILAWQCYSPVFSLKFSRNPGVPYAITVGYTRLRRWVIFALPLFLFAYREVDDAGTAAGKILMKFIHKKRKRKWNNRAVSPAKLMWSSRAE